MSDAELAAIVYAPVKPITGDARKADFISRIDYFLKELGRTGTARLLLWQEYRKLYPEGYAYTQFCVLLAQLRKVACLPCTLTTSRHKWCCLCCISMHAALQQDEFCKSNAQCIPDTKPNWEPKHD